jgi:CheY-like chemotaxis protein
MSNNSNILVVDDDEFIRLVIGENLSRLGYEVDFAEDGKVAWEKINLHPEKYDLILLDRVMPEMDGISLLQMLKADRRFSELPVVMLTGANRPEDIVEGLAAGAYHYLVKPASQELLASVVKNVLDERFKRRELHERIGRQKSNLRILQQAVFSFHTLREARDLALFLADISMCPERTVTGYLELLINAVEHGNLGISYAEKTKLLIADKWDDEIESRLQSLPYAELRVKVIVEKNAEKLTVTITDQGHGFDWNKYLDFDPERAFDLHGRGIAMSRGACFDELEFLGKGNSVMASVRLNTTPDTNQSADSE